MRIRFNQKIAEILGVGINLIFTVKAFFFINEYCPSYFAIIPYIGMIITPGVIILELLIRQTNWFKTLNKFYFSTVFLCGFNILFFTYDAFIHHFNWMIFNQVWPYLTLLLHLLNLPILMRLFKTNLLE